MCMNTKDTNGQSNKHFTPEIFSDVAQMFTWCLFYTW